MDISPQASHIWVSALVTHHFLLISLIYNISHHSTLAAYLTVGCLINLYGRHSLLPRFPGPIFSPIFSLSPRFSFGL